MDKMMTIHELVADIPEARAILDLAGRVWAMGSLPATTEALDRMGVEIKALATALLIGAARVRELEEEARQAARQEDHDERLLLLGDD